MQSTARRMGDEDIRGDPARYCVALVLERLLVVLGLQDLATTVETVGADVVTQVQFASGRLNCGGRGGQSVVRTVHAALGRTLLVLLNGHDGLLLDQSFFSFASIAKGDGRSVSPPSEDSSALGDDGQTSVCGTKGNARMSSSPMRDCTSK